MTDPFQKTAINAIYQKYYNKPGTLIDTEDSELISNSLNDAYQSGLNRGLLEHPTYRQIDIEGLLGHYATYKREPDSNIITTEVLTPGIELVIKTSVDDYEEQRYATEQIYRLLECETPTDKDIDKYMRPFEHLSSKTSKQKNEPKPSLENITAEYNCGISSKLPDGYHLVDYMEDIGELKFEIDELIHKGKLSVEKANYRMAVSEFKDVTDLKSIRAYLLQGKFSNAISGIDKLDTKAREHIPNRLYGKIYKME